MKHITSPVAYREDINGLRAWAVIAVLLFHFQLPGLGAGFFGVDIFFVISGFLMTAIIVKGLERDNFSIWKFYMARARRILPALMVVIAVLLALGWFWLPTPDYQTLGSQSTYSLSFLSNIHFWRSTGYFDAAAHEKWLLHTWSLAVEAQFYLLFPIFLIILWKIKPQLKTLFWGLGLVFIASLALSIAASSWKPVAGFYLLPTRGWELAAGGLAFLIGREVLALQRVAKPLFWCGFALWALAFVLLDSGFAWPSGWALLPVLGTVLIIFANQSQAKLTVNPIAQWLGDRSYSLYLWHWPLVVALYFAGLQNDWLWISGAIGLSLVLAHLSYHLVEVPTRSYLSTSSLRKEIFAIALAGLVIGLAAVSVRQFTFESRLPPEVDVIAFQSFNGQESGFICGNGIMKESDLCIHGDESKIGAIIWGDSHANAIATALGDASSEGGALEITKPGCLPIMEVKFASWTNLRPNDRCVEFNDFAMQVIEKHQGIPLVLSARWTAALIGIAPGEIGYEQERVNVPKIYFTEEYNNSNDSSFFKETLNKLVETVCPLTEERNVFIVLPIPEMGVNVPPTISRHLLWTGEKLDISIDKNEFNARHVLFNKLATAVKQVCKIHLLDPIQYLCDESICNGSENGFPLYYDDDHLSEFGNKKLVTMFQKVFEIR